MDLILKNVHAADPQTGLDCVTDIAVKDGKIVKIGDCGGSAERVIDCSGLYAVPGLFDMHVHFRDPGLTYKEDIFTGVAAAKAGGVTGVLLMPNSKPACDTPETVKYILDKGAQTGINVYTSACITEGMSGGGLCDYEALKNAGVFAITDDGRPVENAELMRQALELSVTNGMTVLSHCEDLKIINGGIINKGEVSKAMGVKGMDRASEDYITAREIALAASCGAHIHICHVSTYGSVNIIRAAKRDGVNVTCETAPHYFTYTDEKLYSRDADYRMSPPLRTEKDRAAIEEALLDGTIDCIITDHAPHAAEEKAKGLKESAMGVVGLETAFPVLYTELVKKGVISLHKLIELMSVNPRRRFSLPAEGETLWDLSQEYIVDPGEFLTLGRASPFAGRRVTGRCIMTKVNGRIAWSEISTEK